MELLAIILGGFVGYLGVKNYTLNKIVRLNEEKQRELKNKIDFLEFSNSVQEARIDLNKHATEFYKTDSIFWKNEYLKIKKISQN